MTVAYTKTLKINNIKNKKKTLIKKKLKKKKTQK